MVWVVLVVGVFLRTGGVEGSEGKQLMQNDTAVKTER